MLKLSVWTWCNGMMELPGLEWNGMEWYDRVINRRDRPLTL